MPEQVRASAQARLLLLSAQIEKRLQTMVGLNLLAQQAADNRQSRMRHLADRLGQSIEAKREERRVLLAAVLVIDAAGEEVREEEEEGSLFRAIEPG